MLALGGDTRRTEWTRAHEIAECNRSPNRPLAVCQFPALQRPFAPRLSGMLPIIVFGITRIVRGRIGVTCRCFSSIRFPCSRR